MKLKHYISPHIKAKVLSYDMFLMEGSNFIIMSKEDVPQGMPDDIDAKEESFWNTEDWPNEQN